MRNLARIHESAKNAAGPLSVAILFVVIVASWLSVNYLDSFDVRNYLRRITFEHDKGIILSLDVDEELNAKVEYYELLIHGKLRTISANRDMITYKLTSLDLGPSLTGEGATFVLEVPRGSVSGNNVGDWVVRLSCPENGTQSTETIGLQDDGTGHLEYGGRMNIPEIASMRPVDLGEFVWSAKGSHIALESPVSPDEIDISE